VLQHPVLNNISSSEFEGFWQQVLSRDDSIEEIGRRRSRRNSSGSISLDTRALDGTEELDCLTSEVLLMATCPTDSLVVD
jgi:hypothetical protein